MIILIDERGIILNYEKTVWGGKGFTKKEKMEMRTEDFIQQLKNMHGKKGLKMIMGKHKHLYEPVDNFCFTNIKVL